MAYVSPQAARRLLLSSQGLLADPGGPAGPTAVQRMIERMGFVQVDTINIVERAHHHILMSRFEGYRPQALRRLLEEDRRLFEHWTHDAAVIPRRWLPYWTIKFARWRHWMRTEWWARWSNRLGSDPERAIEHVRSRITREGGLRSRDFESEGRPAGGWWSWKPSKSALEYLWRTGELGISRRDGFQKVYDLAERLFPELVQQPGPGPDEHRAWACRAALERLGAATATEVAHYLSAIQSQEAREWLESACEAGDVERIALGALDGTKPRPGYALRGWRRRLAAARRAPSRIRPLSPFDPILRDRARAKRIFGFDYRFEAFVPAAKRRYGYYVMPLLEGERLIGRIDPKLHRDRGELVVRGPWWEPGVEATRARKRRLERALDRFADQLGAERWSIRSQ